MDCGHSWAPTGISKALYDSDDLRLGRSNRSSSRNLGHEPARSDMRGSVAPSIQSEDVRLI